MKYVIETSNNYLQLNHSEALTSLLLGLLDHKSIYYLHHICLSVFPATHNTHVLQQCRIIKLNKKTIAKPMQL